MTHDPESRLLEMIEEYWGTTPPVDPKDVALARKLSHTLDDNSVCDARVKRELEAERRYILTWVEDKWHEPTRSEIVGFLKGRIEMGQKR